MAQSQFKKRTDQEKRSVQMLIRWTEAEAEQVRKRAKSRSLEVSDYVRRAALGRRADLDFATEIVLELSDMTRAVRALHAAMVERGIRPPEDALLPLIFDARAAMLRISK